MPLIETEKLTRLYRLGDETVHALSDVTLAVDEGDFVAVMGPSGSGKSTFMNVIGCLDRPTSGAYRLDGETVSTLGGDALAAVRNHKIGFVFQAYNLLAITSAMENVELPLFYNSSVSAKQRHDKAVAALESVKLADRLEHLPNQLSGGQQQRVAIARALVNDPIMILADEATGNLDSKTSYEIMALIQELNQQGRTIVFVTHEPDIASFSSRTIMLKDGRVIKDSRNESVRSAKDMLAALPTTEDY